jgi:hypothetical protein
MKIHSAVTCGQTDIAKLIGALLQISVEKFKGEKMSCAGLAYTYFTSM